MDSKNLPRDYKGYRLKSLDELLDSLEMGMEVNFFLDGRWYLMEDRGERKLIAECPDGNPVFYDDWDALLVRYTVDGHPIGERWREFEVETL